MRSLRILVLQPDFSQYTSAYYQHEFTQALGREHTVFQYGPGCPGYSNGHTIQDVLEMCPFEPDVICFAAGWEIEDESIPEYDPHPAIDVRGLDIPSVMILNKEYKKLPQKFDFIRRNEIRIVFTVHHHFQEWQEQLGTQFVHFPFAVNENVFGNFDEKRVYALGFSGLLQLRYSDVRTRVKNRLFLSWPLKRPRYWRTRIFWFDGRRIPLVNRHVSDYARLLARSKMWLATPGPAELVGTRYYEVMASGTVLFCSRSDAYGGLFVEGKHCVMFEPDLGDFDEVLFRYLRDSDAREQIAHAGRAHVLENHTWSRRVQQFSTEVAGLL